MRIPPPPHSLRRRSERMALATILLAPAALADGSAAGEWTNSGVPDVVHAGTTRLWLEADPSYAVSRVEGPTAVDDVVALPGDDTVLALTPAGVERVTFDFDSAGGPLFTSTLVASGWGQGVALRSADLDGAGDLDLVVAANDGHSVWFAHANGSGYTVGSNPAFSTLGVLHDLVVAPIGTGGATLIVCCTTLGLEFYSTAGSLVSYSVEPEHDGHLAVADSPVNPVIWVRRVGTEYTAQTVQNPWSYGASLLIGRDLQSIAAGDFDGNGGADLAFVNQDGRAAIVVYDDGGSLSLSGLGFHTLRSSGAYLDATPLLADLDHDGDLDLCVTAEGYGRAVLVRGDVVPADAYRPSVWIVGGVPQIWLPGVDGDHALNIRVAHTPERFPNGATHMELAVWKATGSAGVYVTDSTADVAELPLTVEPPTSVFPDLGGNLLELPAFDGATAGGTVIFSTLRYVERDGTGATLRAWPALVQSIVHDMNADGLSYLASGWNGPSSRVPNVDPSPWLHHGGGSEVGSGGDGTEVPDYPPGSPPTTRPPSGGTGG